MTKLSPTQKAALELIVVNDVTGRDALKSRPYNDHDDVAVIKIYRATIAGTGKSVKTQTARALVRKGLVEIIDETSWDVHAATSYWTSLAPRKEHTLYLVATDAGVSLV